MSKGRMEAFSDGVVAILITIMVLGLGVPHGTDLAALGPLWPVALSYVLSFVNLAIWWAPGVHGEVPTPRTPPSWQSVPDRPTYPPPARQ